MSVKCEGLLIYIKTANVFHHPVKVKNLNLDFILSIKYMYQSFIT